MASKVTYSRSYLVVTLVTSICSVVLAFSILLNLHILLYLASKVVLGDPTVTKVPMATKVTYSSSYIVVAILSTFAYLI